MHHDLSVPFVSVITVLCLALGIMHEQFKQAFNRSASVLIGVVWVKKELSKMATLLADHSYSLLLLDRIFQECQVAAQIASRSSQAVLDLPRDCL